MDFLKSAVASAIAAKGPPFPYTFGDKVDLDPLSRTLYNGTRRVSSYPTNTTIPSPRYSRKEELTKACCYQEDGSDCSIFAFDANTHRSSLLARNALKKLRTMRHPGVIKILDTVEVRPVRPAPGRDRGTRS